MFWQHIITKIKEKFPSPPFMNILLLPLWNLKNDLLPNHQTFCADPVKFTEYGFYW